MLQGPAGAASQCSVRLRTVGMHWVPLARQVMRRLFLVPQLMQYWLSLIVLQAEGGRGAAGLLLGQAQPSVHQPLAVGCPLLEHAAEGANPTLEAWGLSCERGWPLPFRYVPIVQCAAASILPSISAHL